MQTELQLAHVLALTGGRSLGGGCPLAGGDALVAMLTVLANVSHPESGIVDKDGRRLRVGLNLLLPSSYTAAVINDRVLTPLAQMQHQHLRNTQSRAAVRLRDEPTKLAKPANWKECPTFVTGDAVSLPNPGYTPPQNMVQWVDSRTSSQTEAEHRTRPAFFFATRDGSSLSPQLAACHLNHPFVKMDVLSWRELEDTCGVAVSLIQGIADGGRFPEYFKGHVAVTMDPAIFRRLLTGSTDAAPLHEEALWLTGTSFGSRLPVLPTQQSSGPPLESLFIEALRKTIEHRLLDEPVVVKVNSTTIESCYDFVSEFLPLEGECPGITRSLRNLMPSLIFGFSWIYGCKTMPEKYRDEIFLCWARALAYRMVAYRQQILTEGQDGKLKRITAGLYQRLGDGPQTEIELVRRFNRLLVADCRTALQQLQAEGRVARHGDRWALASIPSPETIEIPTNNP